MSPGIALGCISVGDLIDKLVDTGEPDARVWLSPFMLRPTELSSYRGYYEDVALGYEVDDEPVKVRDLLEDLLAILGAETHGYKGGRYRADRSTALWAANWGEAPGIGITGIKKLADGLYELTTEVVDP